MDGNQSAEHAPGPQLPSVGQDRKGPKSPHYRRSHPEMVKLPPDERAKDSVIDYLHSLRPVRTTTTLPINFSNTVLAQERCPYTDKTRQASYPAFPMGYSF